MAMARLVREKATIKQQLLEAQLALEECDECDDDHRSSTFTSKMMTIAKAFPLARPTQEEFVNTVYVHTNNAAYNILKEIVCPVLWQDWMSVHELKPSYDQARIFLERLFATCHDVSIACVMGELKTLYKLTAGGLPADLSPAAVFDYVRNRGMRIQAMGGDVFAIGNTQLIAMTCDLLTEAFGDAIRGPIADSWLRPISSSYASSRGNIVDATDADMLKFRETLSAFSHLKTKAKPRKTDANAKEAPAKPPAKPAQSNAAPPAVSVAASPGAAAGGNGASKKKKQNKKPEDPKAENNNSSESFKTNETVSARESTTVSIGAVRASSGDSWFDGTARAPRAPAPESIPTSGGRYWVLDAEDLSDSGSDSESPDIIVLAGAGAPARSTQPARSASKPTKDSKTTAKATPPEPKTGRDDASSSVSMIKLDSAADVSILGNSAKSVTDVVSKDVAIQPLGPKGHKVRATSYGKLNGILTCAVTGRHLPLSVGAYGGTGNESTIWSTRDINAAGGWVTFGPNGIQYMHLPNRGRFYMTTDGHAIVAHAQPGESPSSAAQRARKAALKAGWKPPSRVPSKRYPGPRAPRQRAQGTPAGQGEGAAPRCYCRCSGA